MTKRTSLLAALVLMLSTGCAQVIAYRQPAPIDRDVLVSGAPRGVVMGVLGAPVNTEEADDVLNDTYLYTDGGKVNHPASKAARILLYTAGDVFTAFLTQVLWMPAELLMNGTKYSASVDYARDGGEAWAATRLVQSKLEGNNEVKVVFDASAPSSDAVAAEPPALDASDPAGDAVSAEPPAPDDSNPSSDAVSTEPPALDASPEPVTEMPAQDDSVWPG